MQKLTRNIVIALLPLFLAACQNLQLSKPTGIRPAAATSMEEATQSPEASSGKSEVANETSPLSTESAVSYDDLWERIRDGFQLHAHYSHPNVVKYIQNYSMQQRYFDLLQNRASPFLFEIVEEIERRGLPLEFALLPMVEST